MNKCQYQSKNYDEKNHFHRFHFLFTFNAALYWTHFTIESRDEQNQQFFRTL